MAGPSFSILFTLISEDFGIYDSRCHKSIALFSLPFWSYITVTRVLRASKNEVRRNLPMFWNKLHGTGMTSFFLVKKLAIQIVL